MTTGALYFFFRDKEDLFASLVEEPIEKLAALTREHFDSEIRRIGQGEPGDSDMADDLAASRAILHFMYQYYDEFQLLLTRSQGSRYEGIIEEFVAIAERHYRLLADGIAGAHRVDDYIIHWMAHVQIDTFVHMLTHEKSEEAALRHIEDTVAYLVSGWNGMLKISDGSYRTSDIGGES